MGEYEIVQKGVCWSLNANPTSSDSKSSDGPGAGQSNSKIQGLKDNTQYFARSYFTNSEGLTVYGNEISFTTLKNISVELTTIAVSNITINSANSGGNVSTTGYGSIITKGVCWGTNPQPTINDSKTNEGTSISSYTSAITGLKPNTLYYVRAYVTTNTGETAYGNQHSFTTLSPLIPTLTTTNVSSITQTSAASGGTIIATGSGSITAKGLCWSTNPTPTINSPKTSVGSGLGAFTSNLTGLMANTLYYLRAYATTNTGDTFYGNEITFTTLPSFVFSVSTAYPTNITTSSATLSGTTSVSSGSGSITSKGICWGTSPNPSVSDYKTNAGIGTGSFTSNLTGLEQGTFYYARAYATSSTGQTVYGNEVSFSTALPFSVVVSTTTATSITGTTASSGGTISTSGYGTITAKGVCWSTFQNPTISNIRTSNGTGTGSFTSSLTGLTENTTYFIRAYATTNGGTTFYGPQVSFTSVKCLSLTTSTVTNVGTTSAVSGGSITSTCGQTITARGVCWSFYPNPTIANSRSSNGTGTGSFTSSITGLYSRYTYYVRSYATTGSGLTYYGTQTSFTTR